MSLCLAGDRLRRGKLISLPPAIPFGRGLVGDAAIGGARPGRAMPITFTVPGSWLPVCRRFPRMRQAGPQPLVADLVGDHSSLELVLRGVGKDIVERSTALQLHGFS